MCCVVHDDSDGTIRFAKIAIGDIQKALESQRRASESQSRSSESQSRSSESPGIIQEKQPEPTGKQRFSLYETIAFVVQRVKNTAKSSLGPSKHESTPEELSSTFGAPRLFPDPLNFHL